MELTTFMDYKRIEWIKSETILNKASSEIYLTICSDKDLDMFKVRKSYQDTGFLDWLRRYGKDYTEIEIYFHHDELMKLDTIELLLDTGEYIKF